MFNIYIFLYLLWFLGTLKYVLFWIYLWQLKEYHVGRFLDHFSTSKGKKLILSPILAFKIILFLFLVFTNDPFTLVLVFLYIVELAIFLRQIYYKSFKKPVKTSKSLFLCGTSVLGVILFLAWAINRNFAWLLAFDIFLPLAISLIVLAFQPAVVFLRNRELKKASEKIKKFPNLKVIAVTGSFGKTSTKEFLTTILSKKFKVLSTSKHQNAEIGIAKCILNDLNEKHQIFIAEVGAYNKGKVKEVCKVIKPKIGVVTGVNEQHMALFKKMDNLLSAEGGRELAESLGKDSPRGEAGGLLVVNGDNKYCLDLLKRFDGKELIYSQSNKTIGADIWTEHIDVRRNNIAFVARNKKGEMANFRASVLGKQNVQNLLAAILVASELGMSYGEISDALTHVKQDQAGMALRQGKHGIDVVDSSYSANPDGVVADLDYLSIFKQKRAIVMPCLIELGKKSGEAHEKIGRKIAEVCDLAIITSRDKFKDLERGFNSHIFACRQAGASNKKIMLCDKPEEIYSALTSFLKSGDAVLLEGRVPQRLTNLIIK